MESERSYSLPEVYNNVYLHSAIIQTRDFQNTSEKKRRLLTRLVAIVPALLTIVFLGEGSTTKLLILSQVILSLQLSFAVIPLIMFTSDRQLMGDFVNPRWMKILAWSIATVIVGLNSWLLVQTFLGWINLH